MATVPGSASSSTSILGGGSSTVISGSSDQHNILAGNVYTTGGHDATTNTIAGGGSQTTFLNTLGGSTYFLDNSNSTISAGGGNGLIVAGTGSDTIGLSGTGTTSFFIQGSSDTIAGGTGGTLIGGAGAVLTLDDTSQLTPVQSILNTIDNYNAQATVIRNIDNPAYTQVLTEWKSLLVNEITNIINSNHLTNLSTKILDFLPASAGGTSSSLIQSLLVSDSAGSHQGVDSLVGANDILVDGGSNSDSTVFIINLAGLGGKTLVLDNIHFASVAAQGTVRVDDNTPIRISSDSQAQNISGGGGNDTLIGSGNDTLTGGGGNDIFGFNGTAGHYTITDFNKAADKLAFAIPGITTVDQLKAHVTSVTHDSTSITYNFGPDTSITLVGITPGDLTASMIQFTLG